MSAWRVRKRLRVAIDGPSGAGKGTAARMLAEALSLPLLDTGLLYRLTAHLLHARGLDPENEAAAVAAAEEVAARADWRKGEIFFAGEPMHDRLRDEAIGALASRVAAIDAVRKALLPLQRRAAAQSCVMDGRDIGTVVLPDAEAKFFLTASLRERARRRWAQLKAIGADPDLEEIVAEMRARDERDRSRKSSPLAPAPEAIVIDTTTMRPDEVLDRMLTILARRGHIEPLSGATNEGG